MSKQWWVFHDKKEWGPYSPKELKELPLFTPDSLVKKVEWPDWKYAKDVSELDEVFKDEAAIAEEVAASLKSKENPLNDILTLSFDPRFILFILIVLLTFVYYIYCKSS